MPPVDPTTLSSSAPTPSTKKDKGEGSLTGAAQTMGKDQFLRLLTAQLKNQDPLEPQKNHEFVAQLAQFSGLEQQISANDNLKAMLASQNTMLSGQLSGMIGKQVVSRGDSLTISDGAAQNIDFDLGGAAETVVLTIRNAAGQTVATQKLSSMASGSHSIAWNHRDAEGKTLPDGRYSYSIKATDQSGKSVAADSKTQGVVSGISFNKGKPELIVGKARIQPDQILKILDSNSEPAASTQAARKVQARSSYAWDPI